MPTLARKGHSPMTGRMFIQRTEEETLLSIAQELLAGVEGIDQNVLNLIFQEVVQELKFSVNQLASDLRNHMGFSPEYALLTASQIVPKPTFYSLLIDLRT